VIIEHQGHCIELFPSGAIRWEKTLFVADLHLGKESVFQKSGLAIPAGATQKTLLELVSHLKNQAIDRLIVLGDLLHAPIGWTKDLESMLYDAIRARPEIRWELVAGNHDRRSHDRLRALGWLVHSDPLIEGTMRWMHEPPEEDLQTIHTQAVTTLCGHLHPSFKVPLDTRRTQRMRCFWIRPNSIVLPAFGGWVGTHAIDPKQCDRIVLCVEGELIDWKC
jgi:DNA ligase-associated metallophosphoesterase